MNATPRIHLIHSNRMERLADWLAELIRRDRPDFPFERTPIVVPQAGLGQWLEQALARRLGIACGLEFPLPSRFLWDLVARGLGEPPERSPFTRGALTWRLFERFGAGPDDAPWAAAAASGDAARLELAASVAAAFDRYLVYRPKTIARWEKGGATPLAHEAWQAQLWRELVAGVATPHRARLLERYVRALKAGRIEPAALPARIHLFGLNPMPPPLWEAYEALSARVEVIAFVPDPCRKFWGEARPRATAPAVGETLSLFADDGAAPQADEHPLLERCGALGREFLRLVYRSDIEREEKRSDEPPARATLLGRLQDSLLEADVSRIGGACDAGDTSIALHACAGAWREVEVMHDALLSRFAADPSLTPADVVVMTPDLARHAPYVAAVFGHSAPSRRLPFRVADLGALERSSVLSAFVRALGLPHERVALGDALAYAELPEVRARFELDAGAAAAAADWLADAGVRWGWDGRHRARWGAGADAAGSFDFGLRRLLLGYATGADAGLVAGVAPCVDAEGQDADTLGRVIELLESLERFYAEGLRERTVGEWIAWTSARFGALFAAPPDPRAFVEAEAMLGDALERIEADAALAGAAAPFGLDAWIAALRAALGESGRGSAFLSGSITVCGMVPLRGVPFRVVCVIGLDEGRFPRGESAPAFDLLRVDPQLGDRSVLADDRYTFLEAICAARDALHLSWSTEEPLDTKDPAPGASSVVVGLIDLLGPAAQVARHPPEPYAAEPFVMGARFPGHAEEWADAARAALAPPRAPARFALATGAAPAASEAMTLRGLVQALTRPDKAWLERLGVRVVRFEEEEALHLSALDGLDRWRVRDRALALALAGEAADAAALRDRLAAETLLPPGAAGRRDAEEAFEACRGLLDRAAALGFVAGPPAPRAFRLDFDGVALRGTLDTRRGALVRMRCGRLRTRDLVGWWVEALTRASVQGSDVELHALGIADKPADATARLRTGADARALLGDLVAIAWRAADEPLPLFPDTADAYAAAILDGASDDDARDKARLAWLDVRPFARSRGESDNPAIAAFARGWDVVGDPAFADLALRVHRPRLLAMRDGDAP